MRRGAAIAMAAALAATACGAGSCRGGSGLRAPRAPVVLISVDTLRADRLPAYGYARGATPHLDRLARESIVFDSAYTHAPLTTPAHASLLTGLLPPAHGVRDNIGYRLEARHATLATALRERGYRTAGAVSAWVLRADTGLAAGFDTYDDAIATPSDVTAAGSAQRPGGAAVEALERAVEAAGDAPLFAFLHLYEPHSPFDPPEPFRSQLADPYDGEVAAADALVGRFLETLRRRGLYDRALVVFVSDHGEGLGDHGEEFHGILLYREVLRVPLMVKLPGGERAGTRVGRAVQLADVMPTVLSVIGAAVPATLAGRSLLEDGPPRRLYAETYYPRVHLGWSELRSMADERWHYIEGPRPELYDMAADPGETRDLSQADRSTLHSMAATLAEHPPRFAAPAAGTPEDMEKLAALGYLGVTAGATDGRPKNPRDEIHVLEDVKHAFRLGAEGRDAEAVAALRAIVERNPQFADVHYELGRVLARNGRVPEAYAAYRAAIRASPAMAGPLALPLAQLSLEAGKPEEAEVHARLALAQNAGRAHEMLARVALRRDDLEAAERELALATGDPVAVANARVLRAEVLIRRNRFAEALQALDEAEAQARAEAAPPPGGTAFLRGDALARLGRYPEAEAAFRLEIQRAPAQPESYARLAIVLGLQHRTYGEVGRVLEEMFRRSPRPETAQLAARTLTSMGDARGAQRWARRAAAPAQ